jgi:hypothetical protein
MRDDDRLLMHLPPSLGRLGNPTASISSNAAFVASIHRYRYQNILKMNISPFLENHTGPNMVKKYSKLIFGTFSGTGTYRTVIRYAYYSCLPKSPDCNNKMDVYGDPAVT